MNVKIALLQLLPEKDMDEQLTIEIQACRKAKEQPDCNGHAIVFDGVAWLQDEPGVRDMCIFEAPEEEGIYLSEIDLDMLRDYRKNEVMGGKYRHPEKYGILCDKVNHKVQVIL